MSYFFRWIKECFNYYIFGQVKEELVQKISDEKSEISQDVREVLIQSIMQNKPEQLIEQINNYGDKIRDDVKDDLMKSIMKASSMHSSDKYHEEKSIDDYVGDANWDMEDIYADMPPLIKADDDMEIDEPKQQCTDVSSGLYAKMDWRRAYDRVMKQMELRSFISRRMSEIKENMKQIHAGKIIPSDQYKVKHYKRIQYEMKPLNNKHTKDYRRAYNRVLEQLKFHQYINDRKRYANIAKEHQIIVDNYQKVLAHIRFRGLIQDMRENRSSACQKYDMKKTNKNGYKYDRRVLTFFPKTRRNERKILKIEGKWNQHY